VLAAADISGLLATAAHPTHQPFVRSVQQPQRKWQAARRRELLTRIGEGVEVVCNLLDIGLGLENEKVYQ
jgi:hypothetical protein